LTIYREIKNRILTTKLSHQLTRQSQSIGHVTASFQNIFMLIRQWEFPLTKLKQADWLCTLAVMQST
jgi:hypothetical protein